MRAGVSDPAPSPEPSRRSASALDWALRILAASLLLSLFAAALHDLSRAWDVGYYHLPFAARLVGILGRDEYVFHVANQARFEGFPLLGELLQGVLWRLTGRAESANLVAFASVPLFAWFLKRRFDVPPHLTVLALLAIPLVQLHATSCYVDLPANAAVSVLVLLAIDAYARPTSIEPRVLCLAGFSAAIAANMRFQLIPLVLVVLGALGWRVLPPIVRELRAFATKGRARRMLAVALFAMPVIFATPLKNAVFHHNPFYPVSVSLLGHALPGPEAPYDSSPDWLASSPRPVRFVCSLLELGIRPMTSQRRWTVDQWMPDDSTGSRMGGFFVGYVLAHLALLAWIVFCDRSRVARVAGLSFGLLTALTAILPQSHELRYYLYWMIVLVSLNLWLGLRSEGRSPLRLRGLAALSLLSLGVVLAVTKCSYVYPSGTGFAERVREEVDDHALTVVRDGERVCVNREPWNFLWAAAFHRPKVYDLKEAEHADQCAGYRSIE